MNSIYTNSTNTNILNNNSNNINSVNNKQITNENSNNNNTNTVNKTDSIEINEKDTSKINTKKAYDAFKESCDEFYNKTGHKEQIQFAVIQAFMEFGSDKIVPSFDINDKNNKNVSYQKFMNNMIDYVKKNNITNESGTPIDKTSFLDFCDLYKEKLVKYDCK